MVRVRIRGRVRVRGRGRGRVKGRVSLQVVVDGVFVLGEEAVDTVGHLGG